jgi:hypothetical protein
MSSRIFYRMVCFSEALYGALLHLYPRAFRQEFDAPMRRVFRDCCRQAQAERGVVGLLSLWVRVMGDLAVTALQERMSQEDNMSRSNFVRAAGAVALLGGLLSFVSFVSHPSGLLRAIVPGSVACMLVGVVGLYALIIGRSGRLGTAGLGLVVTGLLLGFIGMAGSALGILSPNPLAPIINTGEHAGLVFIGMGLLLWGIATVRLRALGRLSALPLVMSAIGLAGIVFLVPDAFAVLEESIAPQLFALCWALLGYALLTSHEGNPTGSPIAS